MVQRCRLPTASRPKYRRDGALTRHARGDPGLAVDDGEVEAIALAERFRCRSNAAAAAVGGVLPGGDPGRSEAPMQGCGDHGTGGVGQVIIAGPPPLEKQRSQQLWRCRGRCGGRTLTYSTKARKQIKSLRFETPQIEKCGISADKVRNFGPP